MAALIPVTEANLGAKIPPGMFATDVMGADHVDNVSATTWARPSASPSRG